ncbi:lysophospholipase [Flavihumibacter rivuli]|uniref:alpha/beta hydrolase n=1 Tax=Flavihumibacter rivuli TaxID=2838156 RepID=UPI001BDE40C1|nr:alpha/beta fold hydrolase [Flavihumibacter rivuli]ULQ56561.1 lysophospholipase [Flavihumibacter rivuli]
MRWFRWLKLAILLYALIGIAVYYLQDYFLFHPEPLNRSSKLNTNQPHKDINIPFDANSNLNIVQFTTAQPGSKGVVLYFHGNRKNIEWYARFAPNFTRRGYEVWMIDYPGFGKSTGDFTEERLYAYAGQLYKLARNRFNKNSIIIYGKSMGTGIAAQLGSVKDCRMLILETPYYSLKDLVGHFLPIYPISRMLHYSLPTNEYLPKVIAPIIIFQGNDDGVIPYSQASRLKPLLKQSDEFITIDGGSHNDLDKYPLYQKKLDTILTR